MWQACLNLKLDTLNILTLNLNHEGTNLHQREGFKNNLYLVFIASDYDRIRIPGIHIHGRGPASG